ncbi:hypothetical protein ACFL1G_04845, partial [Planctomycetota bacterium]
GYGHFEDTAFLSLNRQILQVAGGSWKNPPKKESIYKVREQFEGTIRDLINRKNSSLWGWKDPRTVLTIDLYMPYLNNPHLIICSRNAESIANSIVKRDKIDFCEAEKIVSIYLKRIEEFIAENPSLPMINVFYEDALQSPEMMLENLISFLNIKVSEETRQKALSVVMTKEKIRRLSSILKMKERIQYFARYSYHKIVGNLEKIKAIFR